LPAFVCETSVRSMAGLFSCALDMVSPSHL
jgi:hypothetical protein